MSAYLYFIYKKRVYMPFNSTLPGFTQVTKKQLAFAQKYFKNHPRETFLSRKRAFQLDSSLKFENSFIYDQKKRSFM